MTAAQAVAYATRLAVEAGAEPAHAEERMRQLVQTLMADGIHDDGCGCPECDPEAAELAALEEQERRDREYVEHMRWAQRGYRHD